MVAGSPLEQIGEAVLRLQIHGGFVSAETSVPRLCKRSRAPMTDNQTDRRQRCTVALSFCGFEHAAHPSHRYRRYQHSKILIPPGVLMGPILHGTKRTVR